MNDVHIAAGLGLLAVAVTALGCGGGAAARTTGPKARPSFDFEHGIELFATTNGMTVALVRDPRTNLATVDLRYDVGAAADPPGLAGLAHLVEHVMFELRAAAGEPTLGEQLHELALDSNASTTWDATHYTTTVAADRLERVLALEGQRMRGRCDELDEQVFARERDVVLAEEAERASPEQDLRYRLQGVIYGADHPYARPIGAADIARATRADVCAFIAAHYTPSAAYLVVTGPFDAAAVRAQIGKTFGPIPAREPTSAPPIQVPTFAGEVTRTQAPVRHPTALVVFSYPAWGATGGLSAALGGRLLADALEGAAQAKPWIVDTGVMVLGGPRAPVLAAVVEVTRADRLRAAADEVFARAGRLLNQTNFDVTGAEAGVILDRMVAWDDLAARGSWIADYLQYADHRWFMLDDLRTAAEGWDRHKAEVVAGMRPDHARVILLEPGDQVGAGRVVDARAPGSHDLAPWRSAVDPAEAERALPLASALAPVPVERYQLGNGLEVALAFDEASPLVDVRVVFPVGTAHQPPTQPLLAIAAAYLLPAPDIAPIELRGRVLVRSTIAEAYTTDADVDEVSTTFTIRGLAEASGRFVEALALQVQRGGYDASVLARVKKAAHDEVAKADAPEDEDAVAADLRFRARLFGAGHPYASVTRGYEPALRDLDTDELTAWKRDHFRARGATLVISGRFDPATIKAEVERRFGGWSGAAPAALPPVPAAHPPAGTTWLAVAEPRAHQVSVRVGFPAGSAPVADQAARAVLAEMVLDQVRDVREGLGASYGIDSEYIGGVAGSALLVKGSVTEARAGAALPRLLAAVAQVRDDEPTRRAAFVRARRRVLSQVQARVAGASTMARLLAGAAGRGEALDDLDRLARHVAGLSYAEVTRIARLDLDDGRRVVELRGQRAAVVAAFAAVAATPAWMGDDDAGDDDGDGAQVAGGAATSTTPTPGPEPGPTPPARPRPSPPPPTTTEEPGYQAVGVDDRLTVGDPAAGQGGLFQGGRAITLDEFLRVSGHGERADAIRGRRRTRLGMMVGGALTLAAGVIYAVTGESCAGYAPGSDEAEACDARVHARKAPAAGLIILGGTVGLIGLQLSLHAPTLAELRTFADEHNYGYQQRAAEAAGRGARPRLSLSVAGDGFGLTLDGGF